MADIDPPIIDTPAIPDHQSGRHQVRIAIFRLEEGEGWTTIH